MPDSIKPKQEPRLSPTAFAPAEFRRTVYSGTAERGIRPEDVIDPAYWAYHAASLKPWDRVDVRAEDGTWYGEYLVLDCSRTWARVFPLRVVMLTTAEVAETQAANANNTMKAAESKLAEYEIKFRGPRKWSVVRLSDRAVQTEGLSSHAEAGAWLAKHLTQETATI